MANLKGDEFHQGDNGVTGDEKLPPYNTARIEHAELPNADVPVRRMEAPELVKNLSLDERQAAEKKLVRRIDRRLLPMLIIMYIMNYLDRNNIAAARLAGLETDLNLTGTQYSVRIPCQEPRGMANIESVFRRASVYSLSGTSSCRVSLVHLLDNIKAGG